MKPFVFSIFLVLGSLSVATFSDTKLERAIAPWGRETVESTRRFFSQYRNILLVRVDRDWWVSKKAPAHSEHHYVGKVEKSYKGDWRRGEKIRLVTYTDGPAPASPRSLAKNLEIVFTREHSGSEIGLDTGELLKFEKELEPALELINRSR